MHSLTLSRPYAEAAFSLAGAANLESSWNDLLQCGKKLLQLESGKTTCQFLADPRVSPEVKIEVFCQALEKSGFSFAAGEGGIHQRQFIFVLGENKRLLLISDICDLFVAEVAQKKGEHFVRIESAYPIGQEVQKLLTTKLEKIFAVKLLPTVVVNQKLIGGFRAIVGSRVLDCSLLATVDKAYQSILT